MCKNKLLFIMLFSVFCILSTNLFALVDTAWVRRYNGPGNSHDNAYAIALDSVGNVYITGTSISSGINYDYATLKYNSPGIQQWLQRYNGPGNGDDFAYAIAVDDSRNVYVTGYSIGSGTSEDYATIKYNSSGAEQWVRRYNGPENSGDRASAIAVDNSGNVYVTGASYGSGTSDDYVTIKYNSAGVEEWVQRYSGPGNGDDVARAIAVDNSGNVYVTGESYGSGTYYDYAMIKYDSAGIQAWVQRYNGTGNSYDYAYSLAVDGQGNVYVTGSSRSSSSSSSVDYATIKYNSSGDTVWVRRYNGPGNSGDIAYSLAVDGPGNVYVTGYSSSAGIPPYNYDYATIKYNSNGDFAWVRTYNGPGNSDDVAYKLTVDGQGNVYVTGSSYSSTTLSSQDYATIKYNSSGDTVWSRRYNGPGNNYDVACAIAVDGHGNVYVTGHSYDSGTYRDYATIKYVQTQGIEEIASLPLAKTNGIEVYPNPAKTFFTIRLPQMLNQVQHDKVSIKIFDVSGKEVREILPLNQVQGQNDNIVRVSLDGIKNGIYFVKVGNEMVKEKLVVTK